MNDYMTTDRAWMYQFGSNKPIGGTIVHTMHGTQNNAWFIPDGYSVNDGFDVLDDEGVANGYYVWYIHEVSSEMACNAFKEYWELKLEQAVDDIRFCENKLRELGFETNKEEGAE